MAKKSRPDIMKGQVYEDTAYSEYYEIHAGIDFMCTERHGWVKHKLYYVVYAMNDKFVKVLAIFVARDVVTNKLAITDVDISTRSSKASLYSYTGKDIKLIPEGNEAISLLKECLNDIFIIDDTFVME